MPRRPILLLIAGALATALLVALVQAFGPAVVVRGLFYLAVALLIAGVAWLFLRRD